MKLKFLIITLLTVGFALSASAADVSMGISADEDGLKSFHLALSEHFQVDYNTIDKTRKEIKNDEELAVVYFIAERARIHPRVVISLRRQGKSWQQITTELGFTAGIFYVEMENPSPPYGKALGHFKHQKKNQWHKVHLTDTEIINLVNLQFVSQYNGMKPDNVAKLRSTGNTFMAINQHIKNEKKAKSVAQSDNGNGQDKGKGKNKSKGGKNK